REPRSKRLGTKCSREHRTRSTSSTASWRSWAASNRHGKRRQGCECDDLPRCVGNCGVSKRDIMPFTATHPEDAKPRQTGTDGLQPTDVTMKATHNRNLRRPRRGLLGGGLAILLPLLMAVGAARAQY